MRLKALLKNADVVLFACPEYNGSITPLLKNAIDWASRPVPDEPPLAAFKGKIACLMSASPGGLGGIRGLVHVRDIVGNIGMHVLTEQVMISAAMKAFDEEDQLTDDSKLDQIASLVDKAIDMAARLKD